MKELSIEEKAKRYDEAIKVAKSKIKNDKDHVLYEDGVIEIFPELRESEDERIRKHLISFFDNLVTFGNASICETEDTKVDNILAWLEKQGEQEPTAWSEDDELTINDIICYIRQRLNYESEKGKKKIQKCEDWLKSLKDRVQPQSYERNRLLVQLKEWLDEYVSDLTDVDTATLICSFTNYLDNKLPKSLRPKSRWKPDSSMLISLEYAIKHINKDGDKRILSKLLEQLKKLREEDV